MNEVTQILSDLAQGDAHAAEQLLPLVYEELRKLAAADPLKTGTLQRIKGGKTKILIRRYKPLAPERARLLLGDD